MYTYLWLYYYYYYYSYSSFSYYVVRRDGATSCRGQARLPRNVRGHRQRTAHMLIYETVSKIGNFSHSVTVRCFRLTKDEPQYRCLWKTHIWINIHLGRQAFRVPNQGLYCCFCCCFAGSRPVQRDYFSHRHRHQLSTPRRCRRREVRRVWCHVATCYSQSCISKGIWRQGIGLSVRNASVSTLCPVVIYPYLCTSDNAGCQKINLEKRAQPLGALYIYIYMYIYIYICIHTYNKMINVHKQL